MLSYVCDLLNPLILALIINEIQGSRELVFANVLPYLLMFVALIPLFWLFHGPGRFLERNNSFVIEKNYKLRLFNILNKLPLKWHKNYHSGELVSRIEKASNGLYEFADTGFQLIETTTWFVVSLAAILFLTPKLGSVAILAAGITYLLVSKFDKKILGLVHATNNKRHSANSKFYDYISNITTVVTLRLSKMAKKHINRLILDVEKPYKSEVIYNEAKWLVFTIILNMITISLMIFYVYTNIQNASLMVGSFVALFQYLSKFESSMYNFGWQYFHTMTRATDMRAVEPIFKAYDDLDLTKYKNRVSANFTELEISDLHFKYEDEKHKSHTLKDIGLVLRRARKIAFVGESGSGKSTLLKILRGLDEPQNVQVSCDKQRFSNIHCLSEITSLIPQEPEIFENTIRYNLTFGLDYTEKQINRAIKMANFHPVLEKLPKGLDTHMNEKGVNLSGGQKQRLAVARGLLAAESSAILLLDEPTSSLDTQNEVEIYNNIFKKYKDKCIVSVLHKLNLLDLFDYVYIFEDGLIVEQGTPTQVRGCKYMQKMLKHYT